MDLEGRVAILTGGARIGQVVARELARRGCALAVTYHESQGAAASTVQEARAQGADAEAFHVDLREEKEAAALVDQTIERFGRIDILLNMASTYTSVPFSRLGSRTWSDAVDVDARSSFLLAIKVAPHMKRAGAGRIINFSDWLPASARPRYAGYTLYYVAKSAVKGMTEALALELAPEILVNAIAPGPIIAPDDLSATDDAKVIAATPLRRWGGAEEIAKAVIFLIETDFITGECLRVDGGRHLY
jgi:NAD(P)-dependent dehydrogenase (short-subunit alcohol dehydrogenase family)